MMSYNASFSLMIRITTSSTRQTPVWCPTKMASAVSLHGEPHGAGHTGHWAMPWPITQHQLLGPKTRTAPRKCPRKIKSTSAPSSSPCPSSMHLHTDLQKHLGDHRARQGTRWAALQLFKNGIRYQKDDETTHEPLQEWQNLPRAVVGSWDFLNTSLYLAFLCALSGIFALHPWTLISLATCRGLLK